MSTETQPSEHAMRAANVLWESPQNRENDARIIDQHAIAPAVAEANKLAEARIDARDKQWSDLWAALNAQGIEAVVDGKLIYEAGKDPVAERDRRIADLETMLWKYVQACYDGGENLSASRNEELHAEASAILAKHGGAHE